MIHPDPDELLTPKHAAALLGVTTITLIRWVKRGELNAVTLPSGQHRYRRADINKLIAKQGGAA